MDGNIDRNANLGGNVLCKKEDNTMEKLMDLYYCKSLKEEGTPIIVRKFKNGKVKVKQTNKWQMILFDKNGKKVKLQVKFNNTTGQAKASGATSMLGIIRVG